MEFKRVFLMVLDSFGIGEMPDAEEYGDRGSNTLRTVSQSRLFDCPNMARLGLFHIDGTHSNKQGGKPIGAYARMRELSKGKDTTTGHWEICSLVSKRPFPTYPDGFPDEIINAFSAATGRGVLCNRPYSGTQVLSDYGQAHLQTGKLIVYTSADSVFQIAAHERIVPVDELYRYCQIAREILKGRHSVGRVIARPFTGQVPGFTRTAGRRDFSILPPSDTLLNLLQKQGKATIGVGKIFDIFAGSGITEKYSTHGNDEGMQITCDLLNKDFTGLCFVNLVDFDMIYGHRNDIDGYAKALTVFDQWLGGILPVLKQDDLLMVTADHGCDPAAPGTDHSREYTPLLIYYPGITATNLGTKDSFADIGKTIADIFNADSNNILAGKSFLEELK